MKNATTCCRTQSPVAGRNHPLRDAHLLQDMVERREEQLLERVDHGRVAAAYVLDQGRHRLEQVVVEPRVAWVLAHLGRGKSIKQRRA